jgi:hypothetical protein
VLVDIVNGITKNVRVLDGGKNYTANEAVSFNRSGAPLTQTLDVFVGNEAFLNPQSSNNIKVTVAGSKFVVGQQYTFLSANGYEVILSATQIGNDGALVKASSLLSQEYPLTLLAEQALTCTPSVIGATQATLYIVKSTVITNTQIIGGGTQAEVGDLITKDPAANEKAMVLEVSANAQNNRITKIGLLVGNFADGDDILVDGEDCEFTAYGNVVSNFQLNAGLCLDPIHNFDEYVNGAVAETHKIKIDTSNVYLQVDIVYYMDGTTETMREKMMTPEGLSHTLHSLTQRQVL